jgi:hypothetical protein
MFLERLGSWFTVKDANIQTKPRGRVQIPLLVAGPDVTAMNM